MYWGSFRETTLILGKPKSQRKGQGYCFCKLQFYQHPVLKCAGAAWEAARAMEGCLPRLLLQQNTKRAWTMFPVLYFSFPALWSRKQKESLGLIFKPIWSELLLGWQLLWKMKGWCTDHYATRTIFCLRKLLWFHSTVRWVLQCPVYLAEAWQRRKIHPFKRGLRSAVLCEWPMQKESWTSCGFMTTEMHLLILSASRSALEMLLGWTECCSSSSPPAPSDGGEHTVVPYPHL